MATDLFTTKAPGIMGQLIADFGLSVLDAAAILGNLGHECGGFKLLQEIKPVVPGSAGGLGWAQWTGPRRRAFEAYCSRNKLDPYSDVANYKYLWVELNGDEKSAIPKTKAAKADKVNSDLYNKVVAFEGAFERAGVKSYPARYSYAQKALAAYQANPVKAPVYPYAGTEKPLGAPVAPQATVVPPVVPSVAGTPASAPTPAPSPPVAPVKEKGFWQLLFEAIAEALGKRS